MTIDEIRIEGEEDGFYLVIHLDDDAGLPQFTPRRYRIGLPDQFHAEVQRTIGRWLAEGEAARVSPELEWHLQKLDTAFPDLDLARDIERGK